MNTKTAEELRQAFAEFPECQAGIDKRETLAENCAQLDAPILGKSVDELRKWYTVMFFNIATDEMLVKCSAQSTAEQRWNMVEPLTW